MECRINCLLDSPQIRPGGARQIAYRVRRKYGKREIDTVSSDVGGRAHRTSYTVNKTTVERMLVEVSSATRSSSRVFLFNRSVLLCRGKEGARPKRSSEGKQNRNEMKIEKGGNARVTE